MQATLFLDASKALLLIIIIIILKLGLVVSSLVSLTLLKVTSCVHRHSNWCILGILLEHLFIQLPSGSESGALYSHDHHPQSSRYS